MYRIIEEDKLVRTHASTVVPVPVPLTFVVHNNPMFFQDIPVMPINNKCDTFRMRQVSTRWQMRL